VIDHCDRQGVILCNYGYLTTMRGLVQQGREPPRSSSELADLWTQHGARLGIFGTAADCYFDLKLCGVNTTNANNAETQWTGFEGLERPGLRVRRMSPPGGSRFTCNWPPVCVFESHSALLHWENSIVEIASLVGYRQ
jgi:hypothetical protein